MIKKLSTLLLSLCFIFTAYASYFTTNYSLEIPETGSRDWTSTLSKDIISLDRIVYDYSLLMTASGITELSVDSSGVLHLNAMTGDVVVSIQSADTTQPGYIDALQYEKINILSNDAILQDLKLNILSNDVNDLQLASTILSNDSAVQDLALTILSNDVNAIGSYTTQLTILSNDVNVLKVASSILSSDSAVQDVKLSILSNDASTQDLKLTILSNDAVTQNTSLTILSNDATVQNTKLTILSNDAVVQDLKLTILSNDATIQDLKLTIISNDTGVLKSGAVIVSNDVGSLKGRSYITKVSEDSLSNEQPLSALATGFARVTTGTGAVTTTASIDAGYLSGNILVDRLNNGTNASNTTYWRGDGSWQTPTGGAGYSIYVSKDSGAVGNSAADNLFLNFTNGTRLVASGQTIAISVDDVQLTSDVAGVLPVANGGTNSAVGYTVVSNDIAAMLPKVNNLSSDMALAKAAKYITQTTDGQLTNEQALSALTTGIMYVTNGTGVITSLGNPLPIANGGTNSAVGYTVVSNDLADVKLKTTIISNDLVTLAIAKGGTGSTVGYTVVSNDVGALKTTTASHTTSLTILSNDATVQNTKLTILSSDVNDLFGSKKFTFNIVSKDGGTWDNSAIALWTAPTTRSVTITKITAFVLGTGATQMKWNIEERGVNNKKNAGFDVFSADVTTTSSDSSFTYFTNSVISADASYFFTTGADPNLGSINQVCGTVYYQ